MNKYIVTAILRPTHYNNPRSWRVEAENSEDAIELIRQSLNDIGPMGNYSYEVTPDNLRVVKGKILGKV